ncbi:hypothetical protein P691DRAFT_677753 [Macrolepiota fuliginosa MF-IS2]|uniref:25S rRNA (uridine-N(3))-methyltransferase BMT5-like domain-containing protein n=1 Tax=Macrolepiota fuliginosa MF-IS2 TaxID=1400762 RepID=A0A9P5X4I1_9AGAR|nr:hypothetical protein P691DRAFT_677753 [Macrolepiota fuliginosa MF-IS2]
MGKGLKAALKSQQSRLKAKEKAQRAAYTAELKNRKPPTDQPLNLKSKTKGKDKTPSKVLPNRRPTIPFRNTDKILLVGEGNFSFAHALVAHPPPVSGFEDLPPGNVTATAYDGEEECYEKYPDAKEIVRVLRERGVEVLFGIDATKLEKILGLKGRKWDRVVWNFPHVGKGITDQDQNILSNQVLILDFLRSAAKMLKTGSTPIVMEPRKKKTAEDEDEEGEPPDTEGLPSPAQDTADAFRGTILITLRNVPPYTLWDVPRLAKKPPRPTSGSKPHNPSYIQLRSFVFHRDIWTGYEHRMTKGDRAHGTGKTGEGGEDRTWEFCLRD